MADTKAIVTLNGNNASAIRELHDLEVLATFENGNAQANISVTDFEFVNEFSQEIRNWISAGLTGGFGIFEGMPLEININGANPTYLAFEGYLDFTNDFEIVDPTLVKGKIQKQKGLNSLSEKASGLTWEYLYEEGILTDSDFVSIPYVVEKEFNFVEFALVSYMIYGFATQLQGLIRQTAFDIANIVAITTSGATGPGSGLALSIVVASINLVQATATLILLASLIIDLIAFLISPVKFHKGIRLKKLLDKGSQHLGYSYNTTIPEISENELVILPSKTSINTDQQAFRIKNQLTVNQAGVGFPRAIDYGYTFEEILQLVNTTFNAKIGIKNNVIEQHSLNSSWWIQQSTYQMPDILLESKKYNTDELSSNKLISFAVDIKDKNILDEYKGISYEIITEPISVNNQNNVLLKGLDSTEIPYTLGRRKEGLNFFEEFVKIMASGLDGLVDFFGGQGSAVEKITSRVGMLKLETDFVNIPKLMIMNNENKLPANHKSVWSAKVLYDKYYIYNSFVGNNFTNANQWLLYEGVKVPFGFTDFLSLIDNSYFYNQNGNPAQVTKIEWNISRDYALLSYRVNEVYTKNLKETFIETE
jgi:hypothetical protein